MTPTLSDWIIYVDESGDHGIASIDPTYPIFVLVFVVFKKSVYINRFVPPISSLKFRLFGHDGVVLHEHDIRKERGPFKVLGQREKKEQFLEEIQGIIEVTPFEVLATVHDKRRLVGSEATIEHLYHQALRFGLERLHEYLSSRGNDGRLSHVVCECRGKNEDQDLEVAFRQACDGRNAHGCRLPFELVLSQKQANSAGLQLADLIARPIGLSVLRPDQPNRAFEVIRTKLMPGPEGEPNWGFKCFP